MISGYPSLRRLVQPLVALALLLSAVAPLHATVTTIYSCAANGSNHDNVFNGFFVQNVHASSLHSVAIPYQVDTSGSYSVSLTVHVGSYSGPVVGTTQTQNVSLSTGADHQVTFNFGDAPFTTGSTLFFTHTFSGPGNLTYGLTSSCPGDEESVGTSNNLNGFSVGVTITSNVVAAPTCPNAQTLCIDDVAGDKRFQITVSYTTSTTSGTGQPIDLKPVNVDLGGLFWFFNSSNPEMLIKVLNGCPVNNHFWVFYSAGTNVGFHVTVKDSKTGSQKMYSNALNNPAPPLQDVNAFLCP